MLTHSARELSEFTCAASCGIENVSFIVSEYVRAYYTCHLCFLGIQIRLKASEKMRVTYGIFHGIPVESVALLVLNVIGYQEIVTLFTQGST